MKLPIFWLKEYTPVPWSIEKLADHLTHCGNKVESIDEQKNVIDIEVTTNRPDTLSILGLAREVSALSGQSVRFPKLSLEPRSQLFDKKAISISVEEPKACPLYTARLIRNVSVSSSPEKIKTKLLAMDSRPVNNVVDVTNFVLFEMGQPLHAFDFDKLAGGKIIVRFARREEKFTGIDGIEHALDEKTLVIADAEKPVAIAGVMGGKNSEVTENTKNILLESAYFDPALVRRAGRRYKISTESSYRFERGVDVKSVGQASRRATDLLLALCGGTDVSGLCSKGSVKSLASKQIILDVANMEKKLGLRIASGKVTSILKSLGFTVKSASNKSFRVMVPSFRKDVLYEEDLLEEILRIRGFDKVPSVIPPVRHDFEPLIDRSAEKVLEIKKSLAAMGLCEIMTYSLLSSKKLGTIPDLLEVSRKIKNPLSTDTEYFRPSLLCGALEAVSFNANRKAQSLKFFEMGRVLRFGKEERSLSVALYGHYEGHWKRHYDAGFFELKGIVENILKLFGVQPKWERYAGKIFDPGAVLKLEKGGSVEFGAIRKEILGCWDIPKDVIFAEIPMETLLDLHGGEFALKAIPKFPSVRRDIAFTAEKNMAVGDIEKALLETGQPFLKNVTLFDEYTGKNIPSGKRSLAFSLEYQKDTATFTDDEINALQSKVGEILKTRFGADIR